MRPTLRRAAVVVLVGPAAAFARAPASAQAVAPAPWEAARFQPSSWALQSSARSIEPALAAASSAVLPGSGQLLVGRRRGWAFLALEAIGWVAYLDRRGVGADLRREYRDFAWDRARLHAGVRVDGDFAYYETVSHWTRSGDFDRDGAVAGIQPETDAATYNGMIWERAVGLFGRGAVGPTEPGYERALEYYAIHAYGSPFLWDWSGMTEAQEEYAELIRRSDSGFRQATNVLGAILANHAVASVDAFLAARGLSPGVEAGVSPGLRPGEPWAVAVSWPSPWGGSRPARGAGW